MLQTTVMMLQTTTWVPAVQNPFTSSPFQGAVVNFLLCLELGKGKPGQAQSPCTPSSSHCQARGAGRQEHVKPNQQVIALEESNLIMRANESEPQLLCKQH